MNIKVNEKRIAIQNYSIDLWKFFMAFAVVAIHTHPLESCTNNGILNIYNLVVSLAVPFFFISSGYLLFSKLSYPYYESDSSNTIKIYLKKIIKMYLLWTAIYCPLAIYHFISGNVSVLKAICIYIRGFLFVGEQYNSFPLWYLLSTIYAISLLLVLLHFKVKLNYILMVSLLLAFVKVSIDALIRSEAELVSGLYILQMIIKYTIGSGRILGGGYIHFNRDVYII